MKELAQSRSRQHGHMTHGSGLTTPNETHPGDYWGLLCVRVCMWLCLFTRVCVPMEVLLDYCELPRECAAVVLELKKRPSPKSPSFTTPVAVMKTLAGLISAEDGVQYMWVCFCGTLCRVFVLSNDHKHYGTDQESGNMSSLIHPHFSSHLLAKLFLFCHRFDSDINMILISLWNVPLLWKCKRLLSRRSC